MLARLVLAVVAASTAAGLTSNALLENVEQQSERIPLNQNNEVDANQITPEWARSSAIGTTAYLGISTLLEKGFGFGKQVKMWETPIKTSNKAIKVSSPVVKMAAKNALSEGITEGLQSLTSTGILLAEGKINVSQLPERLQDAWKEAVIGGLFAVFYCAAHAHIAVAVIVPILIVYAINAVVALVYNFLPDIKDGEGEFIV